ncbi:MAG: helix-turn-helix domain-containing protein [Sporichthyaceae bacterium]
MATRLANSQNSLVGRGRVADAADRGGRVRFVRQQLGRIALSQATLAAMLDAQRPSVNKVLGEPAAAGLIEVSYPNIRVVDVARLAEVT